jgi:hypothetical protein
MFCKSSCEKVFASIKNEPIYLIYIKSHREQLYWSSGMFATCLMLLILILFLSYLGWALPNYFRIAGAVADASALRWKSMKPYDHD